MRHAKTRKYIFCPLPDLTKIRFSTQEWFPIDVQFSIKNSYPPVDRLLISVPQSTGDVDEIQRTHDVGIKVIGNGHINQLV